MIPIPTLEERAVPSVSIIADVFFLFLGEIILLSVYQRRSEEETRRRHYTFHFLKLQYPTKILALSIKKNREALSRAVLRKPF